ncbi:alpha-2-macroglobulin family protein [Puia sp. P3]|uniref:alpha-2-macroglobulin family protein n=1 Tax=Puia sp. P3 TaxID=3423952 RepID=UPI003D67459A
MVLAHTKELAFGYSEKTVVTQKQLMVQPNVPRFLREGDHLDLPVKVVNLTDSEMTGQVALQLTDPTTGETADGWFTNRQPNQYFTVGPGQSAVVSFPLVVPFQYNRPLTYRVTAQSKSYSDGEEAVLPVVSNRMLVTETLPLDMKGDGTRQFTFGKLLHSGGSETLNHHALTVEFTANPVWYAVQSLPYLSEYPYECAEQTFNRWYANALAARIVGSSPRLKEIFRRWETQDTAALLSNLQKNQELKSVLLEETPWVLQGKTEEQQKKNVARLFDMNRMSTELATTFDRLKAMQSEDGGFAWFKGGMNDLYITQYILTGIGHMQAAECDTRIAGAAGGGDREAGAGVCGSANEEEV